MTTDQHAIALRLDEQARRRLENAAKLARQSPASFAKQATDDRARNVLLDWAVRRYHEGDTTYSLLAEETGLDTVEIMYAMGDDGLRQALDAFLARADALAAERGNADLPRLARRVAAQVLAESRTLRDWADGSENGLSVTGG